VLQSRFFLNDSPFQENDFNHTFRVNFNIKTNREDLIELFKSFKIENKELINNFDSIEKFEKAKFVLNTLSSSHIFNIQGASNYISFDLRDSFILTPNQEYLNKLDFVSLFENLPKKIVLPTELNELLSV